MVQLSGRHSKVPFLARHADMRWSMVVAVYNLLGDERRPGGEGKGNGGTN